MSKRSISRRDFLRNSALTGATLSLSKFSAPAYAKVRNASDIINVGVIGTGSRGNFLMDEMRKLENIRITDMCDIYAPHLQQAWERNGKKGQKHTHYRRLLENKEIDAVFVVTPLVYHGPQSLAALDAGNHVYCEKTMAYSVKAANELVRKVNETGLKFQVGYARWTNMVEKSKELVEKGSIGKIHHIFSHYHRNNTWVRPIDDPKWFRRLNWRLYWEYCGGQMTELLAHQICEINYMLGSHPISAIGTGAIDFYKEYKRETWDNIDVVFEYPGRVKANMTSNFMNAKMGVSIEYLGTNGTIAPVPRKIGIVGKIDTSKDKISLFWETDTEHIAAIGIKKGSEVMLGQSLKVSDSPVSQPGRIVEVSGEPKNLAAQFFDCIRNDENPIIGVEEGRNASIQALLGNKAIRLGRKVTWDEMLAEG